MRKRQRQDLQAVLAYELGAIIDWAERLEHRVARVNKAASHNTVIQAECRTQLHEYRKAQTAFAKAAAVLRPTQRTANRRIGGSAS